MLTREFTFERATKNTYRFAEVAVSPDAGDLVVGVLYVQKAAFDAQPSKLRVQIEDITNA
jgi:hypothetical protein